MAKVIHINLEAIIEELGKEAEKLFPKVEKKEKNQSRDAGSIEKLLESLDIEDLNNLSADKICKLLHLFEYEIPKKIKNSNLFYTWKPICNNQKFYLSKSGETAADWYVHDANIHELTEYEAILVIKDKIKSFKK